ncbi:MAG: UDP-N-acetylmuramate dehydrogenase [Patescibacteria group bacterium]
MHADRIKKSFGDRLKEHEPLARHVNIRIGGPADFYVEAKSSEELAAAIEACLADGVAFVVFGGGSNTLPSDEGFRGLVIQAANRDWRIEGERVYAEAGVPSAFLARKTAEAGLAGLEWAISLPGTIGGAVRGNAGCFGGETKDVLASVDALRVSEGKLERVTYTPEDCRFSYRESAFKRSGDVVLDVELELTRAPKEECLARLDAALSRRKLEQPSDSPSAGCMFKNFEFKDEADIAKLMSLADVPEAFLKARRVPAGWLIEQADLKGKTIGGARVSEKHGNFLLNLGNATASDVLRLISLVKMKVRDAYGVQLEEEVQLLGF